jgi:hypothetical protein
MVGPGFDGAERDVELRKILILRGGDLLTSAIARTGGVYGVGGGGSGSGEATAQIAV